MPPARQKRKRQIKKICLCTPFCRKLLTGQTRAIHRSRLTFGDEEYRNDSEHEGDSEVSNVGEESEFDEDPPYKDDDNANDISVGMVVSEGIPFDF